MKDITDLTTRAELVTTINEALQAVMRHRTRYEQLAKVEPIPRNREHLKGIAQTLKVCEARLIESIRDCATLGKSEHLTLEPVKPVYECNFCKDTHYWPGKPNSICPKCG